MRVPWKSDSHGKRTDALVELVDLFPSLAELAGVNSECLVNMTYCKMVNIVLFSQPYYTEDGRKEFCPSAGGSQADLENSSFLSVSTL